MRDSLKMYWKICWCYVTPLLLSFLVVVKFVQHQPLKSVEYKICGEEVPYVWPNGCPIVEDVTFTCGKNSTGHSWVKKETVKYIDDNGSKADIQSLGLLISFSSVLLIPLVGLYQVWKRTHKGKPIGMAMWRPTHNWKPALATAQSIQNIVEEDPKSAAFKRQSSRRGSRKSFRKHLPPNAELLE